MTDDEHFDALLEASSLGSPHVKAITQGTGADMTNPTTYHPVIRLCGADVAAAMLIAWITPGDRRSLKEKYEQDVIGFIKDMLDGFDHYELDELLREYLARREQGED